MECGNLSLHRAALMSSTFLSPPRAAVENPGIPNVTSKLCAKYSNTSLYCSRRSFGHGRVICQFGFKDDRLPSEKTRNGIADSRGNEWEALTAVKRSREVVWLATEEEDRAAAAGGGELSLFSAAPMLIVPAIAEGAGYSQASYYTSLGLFIISVPGVWSLIKRSTKSKVVRKTFVVPGPNAENGKVPSLLAGEITSSLTRNNFSITDRGEVVTFEGFMVPSRGQAAFLSFCTAISLGCVALVLTITNPEVGSSWYYLTLISPLAGLYYWTRASRKEEIKVKLVVSDDETSTDVTLQGDDEQIDRLRRELGLMEKGMVYVKGIFEQ